jgi:hypothetical protein
MAALADVEGIKKTEAKRKDIIPLFSFAGVRLFPKVN